MNKKLLTSIACTVFLLVSVNASYALCSKASAEAVALRTVQTAYPGAAKYVVLPGTHLESEGGVTYWDVHVKLLDSRGTIIAIYSVEVSAASCQPLHPPEPN